MADLAQLESALVKAHDAGNADHARILAGEIARLRSKPKPGAIDSFAAGANEGIAGLLGTPGNIAGLLDSLLTAAYEAGYKSVTGKDSKARANREAAGSPVGRSAVDSESIKSGMESVGINTVPNESTPENRFAADLGRGVGAGAAFGPAGLVSGVGAGAGSFGVKESGLKDAAGQAAPLVELAASVGGGMLASGVANTASKAANVARGGAGTPQLDAMRAEGIAPRMAADVSGSNAAKQTTAFLRDAPITGGIIQRAAQNTVDDIAAAVEKRAASYGTGTSPAEAGVAIQSGVGNYARRVGEISEKMYSRLDRMVPRETPVQATATLTKVADLAEGLKGLPKTAEKLTPSLFKNLLDDLTAPGGNPSFGTLSRLRTEIGKKLGDPMLADDISRGELKQLYGALSTDLRAAAVAQGPDAARAFDRTNAFYRAQMEFIDNAFRKFSQSGLSPETFYQWGTAEGRVGATRLAALKKAMGRDEFGVVSSTVLRRLGTAGKDADFSPAVFVREWEKLTPAAKDVLFSGPGWEGYAKSVDNLAMISKELRTTGALANSSRTAGSAQLLSWLGAIGGASVGGGATGAAAGVGATVALQGAASKLLTSPSFAKWLATPIGPNEIPKHLSALVGVAKAEPGIAAEIKQYLDHVGRQE